jgi:Zn-dependent protease
MDFSNISAMIKELIIMLPILFFSVILHECGHGIIAYKCGDPTAKMMGRITLNPIPHIDIFGTIIVPLVFIFSGSGMMLGWAKPVPVNYFNLHHPKRDMIWVSLGGIGANIILAIIGVLALFIVIHLPVISFNTPAMMVVIQMFKYLFEINVILAVFNLIPIPPLDGSRIVMGLLPVPFAEKYAKLEPFGIIIVFGLLFLGVFDKLFQVVFILISLLFRGIF